MKITTIILCLVMGLMTSCATTYLQLNSTQLQEANTAFANEDYALCNDLLSDFDIDDFIIGAQHEYAYMRGISAHHLNRINLAISHLEDYLAMPGAVPGRMRIAEKILLDYANRYIAGEIKILWLFTAPSNGYAILESLAILGTTIEVRAEAIARYAEFSFNDRRYKTAVNYYAMLLNPRFAALGWNDRATYRFTECRYLMLVDNKSDEESILYALNSARSYLDTFPAGLNRVDANAILNDCISRLVKLHVTIAEYYVTIGNRVGAVHHFKLASGEESQGDSSKVSLIPSSNSAAQLAAQRLAEYAK
ncbi:MAG: hypothetical protein ACI84O_001387 [Myxococcota bacterium]|jgi:hypothetical protein